VNIKIYRLGLVTLGLLASVTLELPFLISKLHKRCVALSRQRRGRKLLALINSVMDFVPFATVTALGSNPHPWIQILPSIHPDVHSIWIQLRT